MQRIAITIAALFICGALLFSSPKETVPFAEARAQWVTLLHDKDIDKFVELYSPDAVFTSADVGRVTGREGIRKITLQATGSFTSDLQFHSMTTDQAGNLAYDSGEFSETLTPNSGGAPIHAEGSYLTVYKKQPGGRWLIVQQVWTEAPKPH
jgi:ketosteroid isomerase-like protein